MNTECQGEESECNLEVNTLLQEASLLFLTEFCLCRKLASRDHTKNHLGIFMIGQQILSTYCTQTLRWML